MAQSAACARARMEDAMTFRLISLPAFVFTLLICATTGASAEWCARLRGGDSCGFATLSQCRATVSGDGAGCVPNPRASAARGVPNFAVGRRAPIEQTKSWRKALQERRRVKMKEWARERQLRRSARAVAPAAAPAAAVATAVAAGGMPVGDLDVNAVPSLSREGLRQVQVVLKDRGFDPGPLNGVSGPRLKDAVRTFQSRYGIAARGEIDNQTLLALGQAELAAQSNR
jgi:hypothetical protein